MTSSPGNRPHPFATLSSSSILRILEFGTDGAYLYDPSRDALQWSAKVFATLGYDTGKPNLHDFLDIVHPDDRAASSETVRRALKTGSGYDAELRLRTADGEWRWVRDRGGALPHPGGFGHLLAGFIVDITGKKLSTAELSRSEARFRAFMDNCPAAVFIKSPEHVHLYVNDQTARFVGINREEMIGKSTTEVVSPEVAEQLMAVDREVLSSGETRSRTQEITGRDGRTRHVMDVKFPVPDLETGHDLIGGFGFDITEQVEQQRREQEYQRQIQDKQRLESVGMLAGGIAHDFNNILMTIMGNTELAMLESDQQRRDGFLDKVIQRVERASELCSQLLLYAGRKDQRLEPVSLDRFLSESAELLDLCAQSGVQLHRQVDRAGLFVLADEVQLRQVLLNLVVNATKALAGQADGAVHISCSGPVKVRADEVLHDWTNDGGPCVRIIVADNGPGIAPTEVGRVFEPFYSGREGGHGLGLPSVLGIVREHEGALGLQSTQGQGARFEIYLPLTEAQPEACPSTEPARGSLGGLSALVVDDQAEVRQVAGELLESMGVTVQAADSVGNAKNLLEELQRAPDFAIIDVTMPGEKGTVLAEWLTQHHPQTKVILSSGYSKDAVPKEFDLLRKPYSARELRGFLLRVLRP